LVRHPQQSNLMRGGFPQHGIGLLANLQLKYRE
jgi:hypothetical protein